MIQLPIEIGDIVLGGRFKNKRITVKEISEDDFGLPTINGRGILKIRVPKLYKKENTMQEAAAANDPKIQRLVDEINKLINSAIDSDGDPIGVVDKSSSWEEPYVYSPIEYKNGQLKITSRSVYKNKPEVEVILKRNMEFDGIPTLKNILKMYRKKSPTKPSSVNEELKPFQKLPLEVKVKQEDDRWKLYLQTTEGETCLTPVGFETKELASHAALTKGLTLKGNDPNETPKIETPPSTKRESSRKVEVDTVDLGKEKEIKENKMKKSTSVNVKESVYNIDKIKNVIGKEVYDSIGRANQQQLEKWLSDLKVEMQREPPTSSRYNKLKHEEALIKHRLEIKSENLKSTLRGLVKEIMQEIAVKKNSMK